MVEDYIEYNDHPNVSFAVTATVTVQVSCPRALVEDPQRRAYWSPSMTKDEFLWYIGQQYIHSGGHIEGLTAAESKNIEARIVDLEFEGSEEIED